MSCGKSISATKQKKKQEDLKMCIIMLRKNKAEKKAENSLQCPPRKFGYFCKKSNSCCMGKNLYSLLTEYINSLQVD